MDKAPAAVVRCSGAKVLRTPSHVKASLTAAMVERSLLAAERSVWVAAVVVGWVADRREVVWPVSVVMAVDIATWDLLGEVNGEDRPRLGQRLIA